MGGALSAKAFKEFSLAYTRKIIAGLTREKDGEKIPIIVFTKGGGLWIEDIADSGTDAVGVDWTIDIGVARSKVGEKVALQGNMDPMALFGSIESIQSEVATILKSFGTGTGHIFNLGHGISQYTQPEHVAALVAAVHDLSRGSR